jgi:hypothetical protein
LSTINKPIELTFKRLQFECGARLQRMPPEPVTSTPANQMSFNIRRD